MSVPLPLMIVVYVIVTVVAVIIIETIYMIMKNIITNRQQSKPPLSATVEDPRGEL
jgi:hypothetical protein